ncbi:endonuclease/exonuclease/phosphatase family protein [Microvirga guangxiensis]|uniref:Metal-dependent hydrolase, endonuclease/exonuclease/phosphatase family n=1 Tax=Microvirga guangxiensis TaxID=549386 RepID=A0A1G5C4D7_9HYPH|nr:endonuclease/exonuclease/phosphatase family protein [Microvirga guangxiensis]SCX97315.1 Metal-dependent hydrolase, endonuclease/exonuclease/phosphatase family [Microvirga guangxiensis]
MRSIINCPVETLPCPPDTLLDEARAAQDLLAHEHFLTRVEAFRALEIRSPKEPIACPDRLRIAALNSERLKHPHAVRQIVDREAIDILLLSEVDVGMARSGNGHTIHEFIGSSGEGYLYGVEFVELDLGDAVEMRRHAGERNACSLHGNAIVSRMTFEHPHLIPLEESGRWFSGFKGAQRRIGGRIAIAARMVGGPCPMWFVSLHLESKTDPADRQSQVRQLLQALDRLAPNEACIIGGDFNTKALPRDEGARHVLEEPSRHEPLFADLGAAGFSWSGANLALPTQRDGPSKSHPRPFAKLDWFFVRGVSAQNPRIVPSVDGQGRPISDHEMIVMDVVF